MLTLVTCENWRDVFFLCFHVHLYADKGIFIRLFQLNTGVALTDLKLHITKELQKKKKSTENLQARVSFELKCEDMGIFLIYSTSVKYPCLSISSRLGCAKQKTSFFSACHTNEIMQSSRQISACLLEYGENASLLSCK